MPNNPPDPPPPDWDIVSNSCAEFNNAKTWANSYGHDAGALGIKDSAGTANYFYLAQSNTAGRVAWAFCTAANSNGCLQAKIDSTLFNIIKNATLDTSTGKITYSGKQYRLYLQKSGSDVLAVAVQI